MIVFHGRIQFPVSHNTELFDPDYKLLIGPEGIKMLIYFQDFFLQISSLQVHFIEKFQDTSQQRINADKDHIFVLYLAGKLLEKGFQPVFNGVVLFGTDQPDQFFFGSLRKR